jgi:hypothetical protein
VGDGGGKGGGGGDRDGVVDERVCCVPWRSADTAVAGRRVRRPCSCKEE